MSLVLDVLNPNNPIAPIASGVLSGLAINGVYLSTTPVSNMSGDSQGGGYPLVWGVLYCGIPGAAWGASGNPTIYGWMLPEFDNANYETALQLGGTTTTQPSSRPPDFTWSIDANTSGQVKPFLAPAPICSGFKLLFWQQAGVANLPGSGTYCNLYFTTDGTT